MGFLNSPVGNFDLGGFLGQERLDITDQRFSGLSRKNNLSPVNGGADDGVANLSCFRKLKRERAHLVGVGWGGLIRFQVMTGQE